MLITDAIRILSILRLLAWNWTASDSWVDETYKSRVFSLTINDVDLVSGIEEIEGSYAGSDEGHIGCSSWVLGIVKHFKIISVRVSEELSGYSRFEPVDNFVVLATKYRHAIRVSGRNVRHYMNLIVNFNTFIKK